MAKLDCFIDVGSYMRSMIAKNVAPMMMPIPNAKKNIAKNS